MSREAGGGEGVVAAEPGEDDRVGGAGSGQATWPPSARAAAAAVAASKALEPAPSVKVTAPGDVGGGHVVVAVAAGQVERRARARLAGPSPRRRSRPGRAGSTSLVVGLAFDAVVASMQPSPSAPP